jgi:hypothetical protein
MSMQTPIFEGVLNTYPLANLLANGPPDDLTGIRKKGCVCVGAHAIQFRCPDLSGVDRPSLPSGLLPGPDAPDNLGQPRSTPDQ